MSDRSNRDPYTYYPYTAPTGATGATGPAKPAEKAKPTAADKAAKKAAQADKQDAKRREQLVAQRAQAQAQADRFTGLNQLDQAGHFLLKAAELDRQIAALDDDE